jgi:putative transposase
MSRENSLWGSLQIQSELALLGHDESKAPIDEYRVRHRGSPSQTWHTFLDNHVRDIVAIDFLTVPAATFRILFCFVVLHRHRRMVIHFNVTAQSTAKWTAQQVVEAFPYDESPRFLLRNRDGVYGSLFRERVKDMGIEEVLMAPRLPWQNPYAERLIGSIRRDCLDHVIVLNERHLRRILRSNLAYYLCSWTQLSPNRNAPIEREIEPPSRGRVLSIPQVGGLHHRYRRAA